MIFWNNDPKNDFDQSARETYEALKRCSVYPPPLHDLQALCAAAGQFLRVSLDRDRNDKHTIGKLDEDLRRCDRVENLEQKIDDSQIGNARRKMVDGLKAKLAAEDF